MIAIIIDIYSVYIHIQNYVQFFFLITLQSNSYEQANKT